MDKLVHYTQGGPWHAYTRQDRVQEWQDELRDMLAGGNPRAVADSIIDHEGALIVAVTYREMER